MQGGKKRISLYTVLQQGMHVKHFSEHIISLIESNCLGAYFNSEVSSTFPFPQHINGLAKHLSPTPVLQLAESLSYQLGSSPCLPDDLQPLLVRPLPPRAALGSLPQVQHDTIICNPDSRAVPTTHSQHMEQQSLYTLGGVIVYYLYAVIVYYAVVS